MSESIRQRKGQRIGMYCIQKRIACIKFELYEVGVKMQLGSLADMDTGYRSRLIVQHGSGIIYDTGYRSRLIVQPGSGII